ncbi:hypothetical protein BC834DRAFT_833839, partial [Gloeopeniophorella convolvens]
AHAYPSYSEPDDPVPVHVSFAGWVCRRHGPPCCFSMLVEKLIDKDHVHGDAGSGDARAVWRAWLILFVAFAFMAGGARGQHHTSLHYTPSSLY